MTFYIDENISTSLAEAFNILQRELNDRSRLATTIITLMILFAIVNVTIFLYL